MSVVNVLCIKNYLQFHFCFTVLSFQSRSVLKEPNKQNVATSKVLLKNVTVLIDFGANCNRLQTLDSEYEQLSESCMQSCNIENPVI